MLRLFDSPLSANCYKIRLLLTQLGRDFERVPVDMVSYDQRPEELLTRNLWGRVPVLVFDDGNSLAESNAILYHLARDTAFLPDDPFERSRVLQWLFFEQNTVEPSIAVARYIVSILREADRHPNHVKRLQQRAVQALTTMERCLTQQDWFVADRYSIADIALYAYSHVAAEGGVALDAYPALERWFGRVREQPGHVSIAG